MGARICSFSGPPSDPGHPGAHLTDSIMMVSVDQKNKTAFLASVPRDLWVKYDEACTFGYEGKINTVYQCALDGNGSNELEAQSLSLAKSAASLVSTSNTLFT